MAQPDLDLRAQILLRTLIQHYIAEGQPIGSRSLSRQSGLDLSAATIRNVMADLEELGLIASPHTSAGRIPTTRGYRLFVDTMLKVQPLEHATLRELQNQLQPTQPQRLINAASQLLSQLSQFASVVISPRKEGTKIRQIEFIGLSEKRILLIIITTNGDVQNRIMLTQRAHTGAELARAANYLNQHYAGQTFDEMLTHLRGELAQIQSDMSELMSATITASKEVIDESESSYVISGQEQLLNVSDFASNMDKLRDLFKLFERKTGLMQLLENSKQAEGVNIFIGSETGLTQLDECSVITAPYEVDGNFVGTVGVIGPTRMEYHRMIPIVDVTAKLLSSALSEK